MRPRYSPRFPFQALAMFSTPTSIAHGRIQNLSIQGCRLETMARLMVGQTMPLALTFEANQPPLRIRIAVVRWVDAHWAGLEFIDMAKDEETRLRQILGYTEEVQLCGGSQELVQG